MGIRRFQEMVFTGRPFSADEMYDCNFVNSVVPRDQLEDEVAKYADACSRSRPIDAVVMQKSFFQMMKQYQGEYLGSLLTAQLESMGNRVRPDDAGSDAHVRRLQGRPEQRGAKPTTTRCRRTSG